MKKLYDLVIRIPVFQTDNGHAVGEVQTTLPTPVQGAPDAVTTRLRASLADAVDAVVEFATAHGVHILGTDTTEIARPTPAADGETMTVGVGDAKGMPPGLAESMLGEEETR